LFKTVSVSACSRSHHRMSEPNTRLSKCTPLETQSKPLPCGLPYQDLYVTPNPTELRNLTGSSRSLDLEKCGEAARHENSRPTAKATRALEALSWTQQPPRRDFPGVFIQKQQQRGRFGVVQSSSPRYHTNCMGVRSANLRMCQNRIGDLVILLDSWPCCPYCGGCGGRTQTSLAPC